MTETANHVTEVDKMVDLAELEAAALKDEVKSDE